MSGLHHIRNIQHGNGHQGLHRSRHNHQSRGRPCRPGSGMNPKLLSTASYSLSGRFTSSKSSKSYRIDRSLQAGGTSSNSIVGTTPRAPLLRSAEWIIISCRPWVRRYVICLGRRFELVSVDSPSRSLFAHLIWTSDSSVLPSWTSESM